MASYAFTFPDEDKNDTQIRIMLPLFDLLNHGNPGASQHFALSLHIMHSITVLELRFCTVQDSAQTMVPGVVGASAPGIIAARHCKSSPLMTDKCRRSLLRVTSGSTCHIDICD